jgi:ADP-ribose pyrophosphatase
MPLPPLPSHVLEVVTERAALEDRGFLKLRRFLFRVHFADGSSSAPFDYDVVDRERLDAVVMAAHFVRAGRRHVFLRSCLRPPLVLRPPEGRPFPERPTLGALWELPAGLVELDERSPEGLRRSAARELLEEAGLSVRPEDLLPLGPSTFPAPGFVGERHFYFHVEVDPETRVTPTEDGSPLERHASIAGIPLDEALALCRSGDIEDAKTEIALRRLADLG